MNKTRDKRWDLVPNIEYRGNDINSMIDIKLALKRYVNIDVPNNNEIRCPDPKHTDEKPSCHVYANNCFCFSCQQSFRPLDLAALSKGYDVRRDFPKLCKEVIEEWHIDVDSVSNKAEVDRIKQQVFGTNKDEYIELFPLTRDELNVIEIFNPNPNTANKNLSYTVNSLDYYTKVYNGAENIPEHLQERCYNKNGQPTTLRLSLNEAVIMDFITSAQAEQIKNLVEQEREKIKGTPTIEGLWRADNKGKEYVENLILDRYNDISVKLVKKSEFLKKSITQYEETHDIGKEMAFATKVFTSIKGNKPKEHSQEEKRRVHAYCDYSAQKEKINELREDVSFLQVSVSKYEETHDVEKETENMQRELAAIKENPEIKANYTPEQREKLNECFLYNKNIQKIQTYDKEISALEQTVQQYEQTHNVDEERKLAETIQFEENPRDRYTGEDKKRVRDYNDYLTDKDELIKVTIKLEKVSKVGEKMTQFFDKRAEHEAKMPNRKNRRYNVEM